jgi:hypothetical protein
MANANNHTGEQYLSSDLIMLMYAVCFALTGSSIHYAAIISSYGYRLVMLPPGQHYNYEISLLII